MCDFVSIRYHDPLVTTFAKNNSRISCSTYIHLLETCGEGDVFQRVDELILHVAHGSEHLQARHVGPLGVVLKRHDDGVVGEVALGVRDEHDAEPAVNSQPMHRVRTHV